MNDVCNYADDTTFHACGMNLRSFITGLEHDPVLTIELFESNYMKLSQDKYHFLFLGHKHETLFSNLGEVNIWQRVKFKQQKPLGVLIDRNLNFDEYVLSQCIKAGKKLSTLIRISRFMNIMKSFIESQFGSCTFAWMFCGRQPIAPINDAHRNQKRKKISAGLGVYQKLLAKLVSWLRRLFSWNRLKCPELLNRVEVCNTNFQYK